MQFLSPTRFRNLAQKIEAFHGILHIIRVIDGSHIQIIAPIIGGEDHYYQKSFYLDLLLQGIIDTKDVF